MRTPAGARQPPLIQRLPDAPLLEAVLNELCYRPYSALAESLRLLDYSTRDSLDTSDRRLSAPCAFPCRSPALAAWAFASSSAFLRRCRAATAGAFAGGSPFLRRGRAATAGTFASSSALASRALTSAALAPAALAGRSGSRTLSTS